MFLPGLGEYDGQFILTWNLGSKLSYCEPLDERFKSY
jgi:hypothetical protein